MKLLENIGFNAKEIAEMEDSIPSLIMEELNKEERLVLNNINILKELDINNYLFGPNPNIQQLMELYFSEVY